MMMIEVLNKVLVMLYVLSFLNVARHGYYFIQAWFKSNEAQPSKYKMGNTSLLLLGCSLAYIITSMFIGVTV